MGTYTDLSVAGYSVLSSKNSVVAEAATIFRESDRRTFLRRIGESAPLSPGDKILESEDTETAVEYAHDVEGVVARLDVMGFTLSRAKADFELLKSEEYEYYAEWAQHDPDEDSNHSHAAFLRNLTFEAYIAAFREVIARGLKPEPWGDRDLPGLSETVRYILTQNDDFLFGFFSRDIRSLIRIACEVVERPSEVVQDITYLVSGGYYGLDEKVCKTAAESLTLGHLENSNRIVLTEGSSDSAILKKAIALLYPHLSEYYSFLDFETTKVAGGAPQLVSVIKAFAAAGIGNKIVALFDNDTAARDALRILSQAKLPPNIKVLSYPNLPLLASYPTIGPSGRAELDVNGLAASIELYLGRDVLQGTDGEMAPVRWKGYVESLSQYHGEVARKSELQALFYRKADQAALDPAARHDQDWSGLDAILRELFGAFE